MDTYLNFDGKICLSDEAILKADNRSFRYGDGLFETLRLVKGKIRLGNYHFERLFSGARLLGFDRPASFTEENLLRQILELCRKNGRANDARLRLVVFRGDGGLYDPQDHFPHHIIQTMPVPAEMSMNENGLVVGVFPEGRKSCDAFANLKSNNFLIYAMAALYARQQHLDDCLVLNSHGRLADSTISNIFYIRGGILYTPPLSEGCVAGVMRRFLLEHAGSAGFEVREQETEVNGLENAEELFLTNAISGIRWVKHFRDTRYSNGRTLDLYNGLIRNNPLIGHL
ncbi:MAG: aminotransferase class IV [Puia sp.]|nr:aminotransferase class IV [Puia sp.]